jgi:hypothetical protein
MQALSNFFLRAKSWQLFLVFVFSSLFVLGSSGVAAVSQAVPKHHPTRAWLQALAVQSEIFAVLYVVAFFAWLWFMGDFLSSLVTSSISRQLTLFRRAIILGAILWIVEMVVEFDFWWPAVGIGFCLLLLFCTFYGLYFVGQALAIAERGESVSIFTLLNTMALLGCPAIGVWIVQPKINRLFEAQ